MFTLAEKRKAIVFGVNDPFGAEVVNGLIESGSRIFLCGRDNRYVEDLREMDSDRVAFFSSWEGTAWMKRTQSMLEWFGSVDIFIFFLNRNSAINGLGLPVQDENHPAGPVDIARALVPYLNKVSGCKMIFVNTDAFAPSGEKAGPDLPCFRQMDGMCRSLSDDLANTNIDVRTLFARPSLPSERIRTGPQARNAVLSWNQRLVAWFDDPLQFGDIAHPGRV